jgi:hypothetical protein
MSNRNLSLTRPITTEQYEVQNGIIVAQSSSASTSESFFESFSAGSTTGDRVNPNPYSFQKTTRVTDLGNLHRRFYSGNGYVDIQDRGPISLSVAPTAIPQWMIDTAFNNALSSMNDQLRGTLDLSVDIAQAGQVSKMLKDTYNLVRSVKAMPKELIKLNVKVFARKGPKNAAKAIGSKWLEYQYGWRPLMQSVYDTAQQIIESPQRLLTIRGRGSSASEEVTTFNDYGQKHDSRAKLSARCEFKCHFLPPTVTQLASQFTSLNPVSIAWELIPYSFVVDWFVNVGGYIRDVETACLNASAFNRGYVTLTTLGSSSSSISGEYRYSDGVSYIFCAASSSRRQVSLNRSVLTSFPLPRAPRFSVNLGSGRLLNAAALLSQHLKG